MKTHLDMIRAIDDHDVFSVDVFDTALQRPFARPHDLFLLIEESMQGFYEHRTNAERIARRDTGETTLKHIYRYMPKNMQHLMEFEINFEFETIGINGVIHDFVQRAAYLDKQVIYVSDTYYTKSELQRLLQRNTLITFPNSAGNASHAKVYTSSTSGVSKIEGGLWDVVRQDYPDKKILHVGSNSIADYLRPKQRDIEAYLYEPEISKIKTKRCWQQYLENIEAPTFDVHYDLTKSLILSLTSQQWFDNIWHELGFIFAGPIACAMAEMVHKNEGYGSPARVPIFVSPYGHLLKESYDQMWGKMTETKYLRWNDDLISKEDRLRYYILKETEIDVAHLANKNIVFVLGNEQQFNFQTYINSIYPDVKCYYITANTAQCNRAKEQFKWDALSRPSEWEWRNCHLMNVLFQDGRNAIQYIDDQVSPIRVPDNLYNGANNSAFHHNIDRGCRDFTHIYSSLKRRCHGLGLKLRLSPKAIFELYDLYNTIISPNDQEQLNKAYAYIDGQCVPLGDAIIQETK
jgi:hypothetical protein